MFKRVIAIVAALIIIVMLFPQLYSKNSLAGLRDSQRYYHRLLNIRRNEPDNPENSYQIANYYYSLQMRDEAIREYRHTLNLEPQHSYAKYFLSRLLVSKGYYEQAFWLVRELIDEYEDNPKFYNYAGKILVKMGEKTAAKEYFERHVTLLYGKRPFETKTIQTNTNNLQRQFYGVR